MTKVVISPEARSDLDDVWLYIAADSPGNADRFIDRFAGACRRLATAPGLGRSRTELGEGVRSLPVGRYLIFYRTGRNRIEILRFIHGARDYRPVFKA
ncbi:MAG: type II toxin-antitoxin system RelE/ParE family toxin [Rhizobiales bacterium]|nr:type II toxin-antitoxin system RelE/ParE family toxin [Hyphomicrobiales bacterium]